jgi:hypothetical protein
MRDRTGYKTEILELYAEAEQDPVAEENFDRIRRALQRNLMFNFDGDSYEISFTKDETNLKFPHELGFQPKDVIVTSEIGTGSVQFNYDRFDPEFLDITTTGVSGTYKIRFIAGIMAGIT